MRYKSLLVIVYAVLAFGLPSCTTCSRTNDSFVIPDAAQSGEGEELQVAPSVMTEMVDNIASPIEMASLMLSLQVPFSQRYLASTKNVSNYNTSHQKAFNL